MCILMVLSQAGSIYKRLNYDSVNDFKVLFRFISFLTQIFAPHTTTRETHEPAHILLGQPDDLKL